jgi:hypothetical protein
LLTFSAAIRITLRQEGLRFVGFGRLGTILCFFEGEQGETRLATIDFVQRYNWPIFTHLLLYNKIYRSVLDQIVWIQSNTH